MKQFSVFWLILAALFLSTGYATTNSDCLAACGYETQDNNCEEFCKTMKFNRWLQAEDTNAPTRSPTQAETSAPTESPTKFPTDSPTKSPTLAPVEGAETPLDFIQENQIYFLSAGIVAMLSLLVALVVFSRKIKADRTKSLFDVDVRPLESPDYLPQTLSAENFNDRNSSNIAFQRILPSVSKKFKRAGQYLPKNFWGSSKSVPREEEDNTEVFVDDSGDLNTYQRGPIMSEKSEGIWGRFSSNWSAKFGSNTKPVGKSGKKWNRRQRKSENPGTNTLDMFMPTQMNQLDEALKVSAKGNGRIGSGITISTQDI